MAITFTGFVTQRMELLSKHLPVHIQINYFTNKSSLETLLQEKLQANQFSVIGKTDMDNLIILESKKMVQRHSREIKQLKNENDMRTLLTNTMNESTPVVQKISITIVSDQQGNPDSCYFEIIKIPSPLPKKPIVRSKRYVADSILKGGDLQKLVSEIIALSTGIKEPL